MVRTGLPLPSIVAIRFISSSSAAFTGAAPASTRIFQFLVIGLAGDALPHCLAPLLELLRHRIPEFRDPLQRLADGVDGGAEPFDAGGNAPPKSFSNPRAKLLQISSALCSLAFTLATAFAISCFAVASYRARS